MQHVEKLCPVINMNAASDLQVAIKCLKTAVDGAYFNVKINLESMNWNRLLKEKVGLFSDSSHRVESSDFKPTG